MPQHRQDHDRTDNVVAEIGEPAQRPAGRLWIGCKAWSHAFAELPQRKHDEERVNCVEVIRNVSEKTLDALVSESDDRRDADSENERSDPDWCAEDGASNRSRSGTVDRENEDDEKQIRKLEEMPAGP